MPMINSSVVNITIGTKGNHSIEKEFTWSVTALNRTNFKIQLEFADVYGLTDKDVFSMSFVDPKIFYINRNVSLTNNSSNSSNSTVVTSSRPIKVKLAKNFQINKQIPP